MISISVVIITYNEAHSLPRTLRSVAWADEILVVDSGSSDETVSLAKALGARVLYQAFEGYGAQKRFAIEQATHDWVLSLDADEVVSPELAAEIQEQFRHRPLYDGYRFPISLVYQGRQLRHSGEYNKRFLRLFNRRQGTFTEDTIHEKVLLKGSVGVLTNRVYHYSYDGLQEHLAKINRYTTSAAEALYAKGKRASRVKAILRFPLTFLRIYVLRLGVLDGYEGFLWAFYMSVYTFTKYTKLIEIQESTLAATAPQPTRYVLESLVGQ
jgi:glycosyltransferase involved in cell wall biosynthesis